MTFLSQILAKQKRNWEVKSLTAVFSGGGIWLFSDFTKQLHSIDSKITTIISNDACALVVNLTLVRYPTGISTTPTESRYQSQNIGNHSRVETQNLHRIVLMNHRVWKEHKEPLKFSRKIKIRKRPILIMMAHGSVQKQDFLDLLLERLSVLNLSVQRMLWLSSGFVQQWLNERTWPQFSRALPFLKPHFSSWAYQLYGGHNWFDFFNN